MAEYEEGTGDFAAVRSDRDPCMVIRGEDLVEPFLRASILGVGCFGRDAVPEFVVFCETRLDDEGWEVLFDVRLAAAVVTRMDGDAFSQQFLDRWDERVVHRNIEAGESDVGGLKTSCQRRCVV